MVWRYENLLQLTYALSPRYNHETQKTMRVFCRKGMETHCIHCGGLYKNPSYCRIINDKYYYCCQLCNIIAEFKPTYTRYIIICKSDMEQLDIIKTTTYLISKNSKVPTIQEIDPKAEIIKIKPMKFFKSMINNDSEFNQYRIFFTPDINIANVVLRFVKFDKSVPDFIAQETLQYTDIYRQRQIETIDRISRWNKKFIENSSDADKQIAIEIKCLDILNNL